MTWAREEMTERYTALHEGLAPKRYHTVEAPTPTGAVRPIGRIVEIQYRKAIPGTSPNYWHPFAPHAQPRFGIDTRGRLFVWSGRYVVTDHGIEDRPRHQTKKERLPTPPEALINLGTLQWIKYAVDHDDGSREYGVYEFDRGAPTIERDRRGDLFVLGGSYRLEPPRGNSMKHRRARRLNPSGKAALHGLVSTLTVSAVAAPTMYLMSRLQGWLLQKYPSLRTPTNYLLLQGGQALVGAGLAAGVASVAGDSGIVKTISMGLGIGGVAPALFTLGDKLMVKVAPTMPIATLPAVPASMSTPPNAAGIASVRALPGAGLPQGFTAATAEVCGVRR